GADTDREDLARARHVEARRALAVTRLAGVGACVLFELPGVGPCVELDGPAVRSRAAVARPQDDHREGEQPQLGPSVKHARKDVGNRAAGPARAWRIMV